MLQFAKYFDVLNNNLHDTSTGTFNVYSIPVYSFDLKTWRVKKMSSFKTLRAHFVFIKLISVWDLFCQPLCLPTCLCQLPSPAPPSWWPGPWSGQAGGRQHHQQTPLTLSRSRPGWWQHHSASAGLMGVIINGDLCLYILHDKIPVMMLEEKMKHHEKWGL